LALLFHPKALNKSHYHMTNLQRQQPENHHQQSHQRRRTRQVVTIMSSFQVLIFVATVFVSTTTRTTLSTAAAFVPADRSLIATRRVPPSYSEGTPLQQSTIAASSPLTKTATATTTTTASPKMRQKAVKTVALQWMDFHNHPPSNSNTVVSLSSPPPVVLLHGLLGNKRNFQTVASSLGAQLESPRRIVGVDLRNHGDSEWSDSMSYVDMAHDVLEFLNDQQFETVVLVGHSMGGKVAQALSLLAPHRVAGLVVLDIAPVTYDPHTDPHWKAVVDILQAMQEATEQAPETAAAAAASIPLTKQVMDKKLRLAIPDPALRAFVLSNFGPKGWKIPLSTIVHQLERLAGFDYRLEEDDDKTTNDDTRRRRYEGDVFFIHGGQSRFVRLAYMDQIAEFFPNHMLTTVRGAGHWVHAEAPDDTVALLKRYLDR
jgi:esterase